jgi:peptidoglycan/LPS O-acetylase OafA/YrhL
VDRSTFPGYLATGHVVEARHLPIMAHRLRTDPMLMGCVQLLWAMVAFHANAQLLSGGFLGVDVFFVLSGYLITQILDREIAAGTYSLLGFYERRVRRLLPALATVLVTCLMLGSIVLLPAEVQQLNISALAIWYLLEYFFWSRVGYFAPEAETLSLLHTGRWRSKNSFTLLFHWFFTACTDG